MINNDFLEGNTAFSNLRGSKLEEVLDFIENFTLEYRESLGLGEKDFFGTEIEYEGVPKRKLNSAVYGVPSWVNKTDGSISVGGEINSCKMNDDWYHWKNLRTICQKLRMEHIDTRSNAGGHVHVDSGVLPATVENYRKLAKFLIAYEHILLRFGFGDKLSSRKIFHSYARPIANQLYHELNQINRAGSVNEILKVLVSFGKCYTVYFKHLEEKTDKKTFEFRFPNTTDSEIIWQNNINCFVKLLKAIPQMDESFLNRKIKSNRRKFNNAFYYEDIDLLDALEFVDLVFTNNLDKVYFLRQYFKNYEIDYFSEDRPCVAKVFVKE